MVVGSSPTLGAKKEKKKNRKREKRREEKVPIETELFADLERPEGLRDSGNGIPGFDILALCSLRV